MTKNELLEIQDFIKELRQSDENIEGLERIYSWIKEKYEEQGEKKLGELYKKLIEL